ncbi:response regulator [Dyadobacter alkalitolerans]|uniref:response regulator n=1 Tax=Dyadobacter alkalitolerans TaxID=492736 RepID=UPI00040A63A7|nr:response regulator transcription factor [Dyadobacter alkalitolerans]
MRVLLVKDHPLIRVGLELLVREVYPRSQVVHATDFAQAVNNIKAQLFNFIILDIGIPGGNTEEMIKTIKEMQTAVPILVYTSYDDQLYGLTYISAGADSLLSKDAPSDQIKATIKILVEKGKYLSAELRCKAYLLSSYE